MSEKARRPARPFISKMAKHAKKKKAKVYPCKCSVKFCRRRVQKADHSDKCPRHRAEAFKAAHPLNYHFNKLKYRAIERGHEFKLTFTKYESVCVEAGWVTEHRGKTKFSLSIDRVRHTEGYHDGNVEVMTLSENSRKGYVERLNALSDSDKADTRDGVHQDQPELGEVEEPF